MKKDKKKKKKSKEKVKNDICRYYWFLHWLNDFVGRQTIFSAYQTYLHLYTIHYRYTWNIEIQNICAAKYVNAHTRKDNYADAYTLTSTHMHKISFPISFPYRVFFYFFSSSFLSFSIRFGICVGIHVLMYLPHNKWYNARVYFFFYNGFFKRIHRCATC